MRQTLTAPINKQPTADESMLGLLQKQLPESMFQVALESKDPVNGVWGVIIDPAHFDATLRARGGWRALGLYDSVFNDAHAGALLRKRIMAVTSKPFYFAAGGKDKESVAAAEYLQNWAEQNRFAELCEFLLRAVCYGISAAELAWDGRGDPHWRGVRFDRIRITRDTHELRITTMQAPHDGVSMPADQLIAHLHDSGGGADPYGNGVGKVLWWHCNFKKVLTRFWLQAAGQVGTPTQIVTGPAGGEQVENAEKAVQAARDSGYLILPAGHTAEIQAAAADTGGLFSKLVAYLNKDMTLRILGETLTSEVADAGAYAAAKVHNEVRSEVAHADADALAQTMQTGFIAHVIARKFPKATPPRLRFQMEEPTGAEEKLKRLQMAVDLGYAPVDGAALVSEIIGAPMQEAQQDEEPPAAPPAAGGADPDEE